MGRDFWTFSPMCLPGFTTLLAPLRGPRLCEQSRSGGTGMGTTWFLLSCVGRLEQRIHMGPTHPTGFGLLLCLSLKCSSSLWIHTLFHFRNSAQPLLPSGPKLPSFLLNSHSIVLQLLRIVIALHVIGSASCSRPCPVSSHPGDFEQVLLLPGLQCVHVYKTSTLE